MSIYWSSTKKRTVPIERVKKFLRDTHRVIDGQVTIVSKRANGWLAEHEQRQDEARVILPPEKE